MAVRRGANIGIVLIIDHVPQRLGHSLGGRADEFGPDRIVARTEEGGVRPRARDFTHAATAERKGQGHIVRNRPGRVGTLPLFVDVFHDGRQVWPMPAVVGPQLHGHVDRGISGPGIRHAVNRVVVGHRANHRGPVHDLGHVGQQFANR